MYGTTWNASAAARGRLARGILAPQLRVVAFSHAAVARLRGARFAKYRSQVLGSRVVVQVRRTWWLATPRGFSPSACRANPKNRRMRAITRPAELAADSCPVTAEGTEFFPLCAAKMTAIASGPGLLKPNVKNLSGEGHFCYFSLAPCRMRIAVVVEKHAQRAVAIKTLRAHEEHGRSCLSEALATSAAAPPP